MWYYGLCDGAGTGAGAQCSVLVLIMCFAVTADHFRLMVSHVCRYGLCNVWRFALERCDWWLVHDPSLQTMFQMRGALSRLCTGHPINWWCMMVLNRCHTCHNHYKISSFVDVVKSIRRCFSRVCICEICCMWTGGWHCIAWSCQLTVPCATAAIVKRLTSTRAFDGHWLLHQHGGPRRAM